MIATGVAGAPVHPATTFHPDADSLDSVGSKIRDELVFPGKHICHVVVELVSRPESGSLANQPFGTTDSKAFDEDENSRS